jgi:Ser/Thr protein kinase RdoA (MazF antagonist)
VRQLFDWFDEAAVEAEVRLAEAAAAAGIRTPRPVRSPTGAIVERLDDTRWRVFEFLAAGPEPSVPADPRHAAAAGRILAKVHNLGLPAPEPVQPWLTSVRPESAWWNLHAACQSRGMPWAERLADVIPTILDACGIVEPTTAAGDVALSGCHHAPNAFRVAGPRDLVITGFDHAGSIPTRWDLGGTLAGWSGGVSEQLNVTALGALRAGYAEERRVPQPLDFGIFSAALCASMNWLVSRVRIAINPQEDAESREIAARAVPTLLVAPPSRERFQRILDALD